MDNGMIGFLVTLFAAGVRMSIPLIYGSVGNVVTEKTGVSNIGLEGQMLIGAFFSFLVAVQTGNLWLGILVGGIAGSLTALISAFWCVSRKQDQSVVGIMINIFALGFTNFLYRAVFGISSTKVTLKILPTIEVPLLSDIPVLGDIFFKQNLLTYLALIVAIVVWVLLHKTKMGLMITATGENPKAARSTGINVIRMRYLGYIFGGFLAGIGGAFLPIGIVGNFTENISSGRGFICLAVTILSRWNPLFALGGAFSFGTVNALQIRLQALGSTLPYQFFVALPYLVTLLSLIIFGRNIHLPKDLGNIYYEESR